MAPELQYDVIAAPNYFRHFPKRWSFVLSKRETFVAQYGLLTLYIVGTLAAGSIIHPTQCIQTVTSDELRYFPLGRRVPVNMQARRHGYISRHGRQSWKCRPGSHWRLCRIGVMWMGTAPFMDLESAEKWRLRMLCRQYKRKVVTAGPSWVFVSA